MALELVLNGRNESLRDLADGATLTEVIAALALKADRVAVERNGEIVPRTAWAGMVLRTGDKLEVVHFVGGG